jgi:hypothetical protein
MATVTKVNGDSQVVVNVGNSLTKNSNAVIINTGISSPITAYKITLAAETGNLAAELGGPNGSGVPGAIETILGELSSNATILAYQIDAGTSGAQQISIIAERSAMSASDYQTILRTLGNVGSRSNVYLSESGGSATTTVSSSGGIKWA